MKIALISDALYKWDGGLDYLTNIAVVLNAEKEKNKEIELYLFIPKDSKFTKIVKKIILGKNATDDQRKELLLKNFKDAGIPIKTVWYPKMPRQPFVRDFGRKLDRVFKNYHIDVAFPVMIESYPDIDTPWIAYIPDLQEKYLPELFSQKELTGREAMYRRVVSESKFILVTSDKVKKDIEKFYPNQCRIYSTPFAPIASEQFAVEHATDVNKYNLPEKYFVISNQFWAHKSHDTAFEALEILYDQGMKDIHLFCTGVLSDYRSDRYSKKINQMLMDLGCRNNIHLLGYIPRMEQIEIIKNATALIQPSVFEGDCGGCSVYLANSLCVASILSDIEVNLEGKDDESLYYFAVRDAESLAEQMKKLLTKEKSYPKQKDINAHISRNTKILGEFYYDMLQDVIENY